MSKTIRIAVDAMGGDLGPRVTIPATLEVAAQSPQLEFILVGDKSQLTSLLHSQSENTDVSRIKLVHAPVAVTMGDKPSHVLRYKRDSSMWIAVDLVRSGAADACVSGGNTGALMAMGRHLLKTFPGIDRPAICKPVPTERGHSYLLDLGANINCQAQQLVQFSMMGAVLAASVDQNPNPSIGLLNIGEENTKGNDQIQLAAHLLSQWPQLNYTGYVEGDGIYSGIVDVVVCDGFVGNVALKVSEGVARFLADRVEDIFNVGLYGRLVGRIARPLLRKWHTQFDPARYNGASFLGLRGTLIKSHGGADQRSFTYALRTAIEHVDKQIATCIHEQLATYQGLP